jgi:squalene synthase HpnC
MPTTHGNAPQVAPVGGGVRQPAIDALSARAAGENFPVAMRVLPRRYRRHLMAVYRFARLVDDVGDEASGDRLQLLDEIEQDLGRAFTGGAGPRLQVTAELARTAKECAISAQPFSMLIQANRQDQTVHRYATFDQLLGYCDLSANPVGRAVLGIFGVTTPGREHLSDLVCTALQLAEHWQDVAEDLARDRIYLPAEDMAAFGCAESDLAEAARRDGKPVPPRVRELLRFETERAARLLADGAALTGTLRGWARLAVAGYVAGGRATLAAITKAGSTGGFDVFAATPRPGRVRTVAELVRAYLTGR